MKKLMKIFTSITLSSALILGLAGCGSKEAGTNNGDGKNGKEVVVGVLYPTSGSLARLGGAALKAVELAVDDINAAGGIKSLGGAKIKLEAVDPGEKPESAKSATERLIQNKKVSALTGDYSSSLSLVTSEVAERAKIPFVTASVADNLTSRGMKYLFQVSPKGSMFGETQVKFAKEYLVGKLGKKPKVAIVFEETSYGTSTSEGLKKTAEDLGLEVTLFEPYQANFADASPLVNKIKSSGAEILFPVSYLQDAILIQKTIKQFGVDITTVGGGAGYLMPEFYKELGEDGEGVVSVASWNRDINKKGVEDIDKRYMEKNGEFITEHSGEAYSAMWAIAHAIEKAGSSDPEKIKEALSKLNLEEGAPGNIMPGGNIQMDKTGWNKNVHPVIIQWQDTKPVTIYPKEDAKVEYKN
ncbi:ABC transporter substrate-binding protein [Neobacillus sp. MER 74]|uniref:ABC transporter substrate-binding protein n=1 Tax=Neobacillus sp. MER 74 TaxID=2939566 RepID=UPI00203BF29C|nr:ABC transporter substrate-binding protein [Neobacillus sp. MER 74]MCM3113769.1 ABC transporter substrate-binding protein [Neobacillus sp. MER 74]